MSVWGLASAGIFIIIERGFLCLGGGGGVVSAGIFILIEGGHICLYLGLVIANVGIFIEGRYSFVCVCRGRGGGGGGGGAVKNAPSLQQNSTEIVPWNGELLP